VYSEAQLGVQGPPSSPSWYSMQGKRAASPPSVQWYRELPARYPLRLQGVCMRCSAGCRMWTCQSGDVWHGSFDTGSGEKKRRDLS
jgi:hypothetical protein